MSFIGNPGSNKVLATDVSGNIAPFSLGGGLVLSGNTITMTSSVPGGASGQVQFNDSGTMTGSSLLTFNKSAGALTASYFVGNGGALTNLTASQVYISGAAVIDGYLQLQPVGAVTIPPTQTAGYMYVSGSTNDIYFTQYQPGSNYNNTTRLRWMESSLYTGLMHGGIISASNGGTTFSVTSGEGLVVTMNANTASAPYPTVQLVSWPAQNNIPLQNSASAKITYVGMSSSGTVIQQVLPWGTLDVNQWDQSINLGVVLHLSGNVVNGVYNSPQISYGMNQQNDDFTRAFGPLKISGHVLAASGSTMSITKTGGTSYRAGANYQYNPNHPSTVVESQDVTVSKIYRYYVSGSTPVIDTGVGNAGYTVIDPSKYFNMSTGLLTTVDNNQWTVQRVFWVPNSPTNALIVYYGNGQYSDSVSAQNATMTEAFVEAPNTAQNAILVGYVIVREGCTSLTSALAVIQQAGIFRQVGGIGSSGQATIPTKLNQLGDTSILSPANGDLLVYDSATATWKNTTTLQGITLSGSLADNGGSITTTNSTFNLVNATATTINFGGAATTLKIGNSTGTNTISGTIKAPQGFSGSHSTLVDGTPFIIGAGLVTVTTASNGQITVSGSGGSVAWPGTSSQLIAGNGTNVTVDGGLTLTGGVLSTTTASGSRPAIDANHLLVYYCDETTGTTLSNSGSTSNANLTLSGTYSIGDGGLFSRGTTATRWYAATAVDGAFTSQNQFNITTGTMGTQFTLEATVAASAWTSSAHQVAEICSINRALGTTQSMIGIYIVNGQFTCQYYNSGSNYSVSTSNIAMGSRTHVGFVRNATNLTVYVNGVNISSNATANAGSLVGALTQASIGNSLVAGGGSVFKGLIADVRLSNIARPQSYFITASKAMGAL